MRMVMSNRLLKNEMRRSKRTILGVLRPLPALKESLVARPERSTECRPPTMNRISTAWALGAVGAVVVDDMANAERGQGPLVELDRSVQIADGHKNVI